MAVLYRLIIYSYTGGDGWQKGVVDAFSYVKLDMDIIMLLLLSFVCMYGSYLISSS